MALRDLPNMSEIENNGCYLVTWEINIIADSARQAAREALTIHRDHESTATVFEVTTPDGAHMRIDLAGDEL